MTRETCNEFVLSWHFHAIRLSTTNRELDGVEKAVKATVAEDHPERLPLADAIADRRLALALEQAA